MVFRQWSRLVVKYGIYIFGQLSIMILYKKLYIIDGWKVNVAIYKNFCYNIMNRRCDKMNQVTLKKGFMSNQDLADWFGVKKRSYENAASRYLEKLSECATFKRVRGGVEIQEIIFEVYEKNAAQKRADDKYFNAQIRKCIKEQEGFASIAGIAKKAKLEEEEYKVLSIQQVEKRMSDAGKRNYGAFGDGKGGAIGMRDREWAIKLEGINKYRNLTPEEREIFLEITSIYYTKAPDKIVEKRKLEQKLRNGEIDKDRYFELIDLYQLDLFPDILGAFFERTGYKIVLASQYEIIQNWEEYMAKK